MSKRMHSDAILREAILEHETAADKAPAIEKIMRLAVNRRAAAQEDACRWLLRNLNVRTPLPKSKFRPTPLR